MPPIARPFPRFMADTAQEARPYGDWEQRLSSAFADACAKLADEAEATLDPETLRYFPERTWGGRTYIPVVGQAGEETGGLPEYYGYVFFQRGDGGDPGELEAEADFTDITADQNPDWKVDLNDAIIGEWRADGGRGGDVTLIWGTPLVRGALAATAELEGEILDQAAVHEGRFTLLAVDAVHGFGDDLYLQIKLWDRRFKEVASESLYEAEVDEDDGAGEEDEDGAEASPAEGENRPG
jgi:hypothetical protein